MYSSAAVGSRPKVVAWAHKFGHVSAMARSSKASYGNAAAGQRASAGGVADDAASEATIASEEAPLKLEKFLPYQLNVVASLVSLALSRVYARRYGIGVPEWRVLVTLGQYGVMTGKAIGAHTHMHKTKVSRAVALMEERKLAGAARQPRRHARIPSLAHRGGTDDVRRSGAARARLCRAGLRKS